MKKMATIVLGLMLVLTLVGCGNNAQSSDPHNAEYEEGYAAGYEAGYNDGKQQIAESKKHFAGACYIRGRKIHQVFFA